MHAKEYHIVVASLITMVKQGESKKSEIEFGSIINVNHVIVNPLSTASVINGNDSQSGSESSVKIDAVESLQSKKELLTEKLEIFKQVVKRDPALFGDFPKQKQKELESVVGIFEKLLEENYQELTKARTVNTKVVEAVSHVVKEHVKSREGYQKDGSLNEEAAIPSITYNKNI